MERQRFVIDVWVLVNIENYVLLLQNNEQALRKYWGGML